MDCVYVPEFFSFKAILTCFIYTRARCECNWWAAQQNKTDWVAVIRHNKSRCDVCRSALTRSLAAIIQQSAESKAAFDSLSARRACVGLFFSLALLIIIFERVAEGQIGAHTAFLCNENEWTEFVGNSLSLSHSLIAFVAFSTLVPRPGSIFFIYMYRSAGVYLYLSAPRLPDFIYKVYHLRCARREAGAEALGVPPKLYRARTLSAFIRHKFGGKLIRAHTPSWTHRRARTCGRREIVFYCRQLTP
jgi:hypothetical protein